MTHLDTSISRDESAAIKGLLILLIILGHNVFFSNIVGLMCWMWLYSFHVAAFFILPFFYPVHSFSFARVKTLFVRLYWPFIWAFIFLSFANLVFERLGSLPLVETTKVKSLWGFIQTLFTGNFWALPAYSGFQYLWFLPVMFSMLVLLDLFVSYKKIRLILLSIGLLCFVFFWINMYGGPIPSRYKYTVAQFSPFAVLQGMGMLFMGVTTFYVLSKKAVPSFLYVTIFVLLAVIYMTSNRDSILLRPFNVIIYAINPLLAFGTILCFKSLLVKLPLLVSFGQLSLQLYIIHQPIQFLVTTILRNKLGVGISLFISYIIAVSVSFFIACLLKKTPLFSFLFPRYIVSLKRDKANSSTQSIRDCRNV